MMRMLARTMDRVYLILLKDERVWIEECPSFEIFQVAKIRDAGICGSFRTHEAAQVFLRDLTSPSFSPALMAAPGFDSLLGSSS